MRVLGGIIGSTGDIPIDKQKQARLPLRLGGLGLRSSEWVSRLAYWASCVKAATEDSTFPHQPSALRNAWQECLTFINQSGKKGIAPVNLDLNELRQFYGPGANQVQRKLTKALEAAASEELLQGLDESGRIRMQSVSFPGASAWLTAIPKSYEYTLNSSQFGVALRFRLGLPPVNNMPEVCFCGSGMTPDHLAGCQKLARSVLTYRHDEVVSCISRQLKAAGAVVEQQPRGYLRDSDGIPDLLVGNARGRHFVEVSVVHPQCKTYRKQAVRGVQYPIEDREKLKLRKYDEIQQRCGSGKLIAAVFDSYGATGGGVKELFALLGQTASDNGEMVDGKRIVNRSAERELKEVVAISLQRGNALAQLRGCTQSRDHRRWGRAGTSTQGRNGSSESVHSRMVNGALGVSRARLPSGGASSSLSSSSSSSSSSASSSSSSSSSSSLSSSSSSSSSVTSAPASTSAQSDLAMSLSVPLSLEEWPTIRSMPVSAMSGRAVDREVPNTSLSQSVSSLSQSSRVSESVVSAVDSLTFHPEPDAPAPDSSRARNHTDTINLLNEWCPQYMKNFIPPPEIEITEDELANILTDTQALERLQ